MKQSDQKYFEQNYWELSIRKVSRNPFIETIFTADPSAHVWEDGRLYVYASRDMDPAIGCDLMDHYHVFSTEDMVNWRDEGEILCADDVAWGRPEGGFMWAPDCAYRNGKYYFYYPHPSGSDWNDTWKIGVAMSDKPASGFVDQGYIKGVGGFGMIDPCVFIDDDGQAYLYYGGASMCRCVRLNEDMVTISGEVLDMEGLYDFHEATWVFKREGVYYLTYSDNQQGSNRLHYAVSEQPLGPWSYKGVYLEPTGCDTSHGSIVEYKDNWYAFYHNQDISGVGNLRSVCCDPLFFEPDGSIRTVVQSRNGHPPVGHSSFSHSNLSKDLKLYPVGQITPNGELVWEHVDGFIGGRAEIGIYYASKSLCKVRLWVNGTDYSLLNLTKTGSTETFTGYAFFTVPMQPGESNTVRLSEDTGSLGSLMNDLMGDLVIKAISIRHIPVQ